MKQTAIFQSLSDETRLRALALISAEGELCVCELVYALDLSQPKISRHLSNMRDAGLLDARRDAQWMFYFIKPDLPEWVRGVIAAAVAGMADTPETTNDKTRLADMKNRPQRCAA